MRLSMILFVAWLMSGCSAVRPKDADSHHVTDESPARENCALARERENQMAIDHWCNGTRP